MNEPKPGIVMDEIIPMPKETIYAIDVPKNGMSLKVDELFTALVGTQIHMKAVSKDAENPFFKSNYADLNMYIQTAKEPLAKHNLAVTQLVSTSDGKASVTTILAHKSGQYITTTLDLKPTQDTPQGMGSAITYARRYAFAAILNMGAEDDDANDASKQTKTPVANPTIAATKPASPATTKQVQLVAMLLKKKGRTNDALYKKFGIDSLTKMSFDQASSAIDGLNKMPDVEIKTEDVSQEPEQTDTLTDKDIEEIDKGIEEMAKEDKGIAADNFEVAWVKAHLTKLMKNKIISQNQVDLGLSFLTHDEVAELKAKYQEMDLDKE